MKYENKAEITIEDMRAIGNAFSRKLQARSITLKYLCELEGIDYIEETEQ